MAARTKSSVVVPFPAPGTDAEPEAELHFGRPTAASISKETRPPPAIDLSGKPKIWFAIGPGRSGKTTLLRYAAELLTQRGGQAVFAAADPGNRSLKAFVDGVEEPPTNDAVNTTRWLERLLRHLMAHKVSGLIDLGGGDTSLGKLVASMPDLAQVLEGEGVVPVAFYTLGPRIDDLASLAALESAGFRPAATAIILNEGLSDLAMPREESFSRIIRHSVFRAAIDRGAVQLWMPRLEAHVAQTIEARRLHFTQAAQTDGPLGAGFDSRYVRHWLERMEAEFHPVMSWLPA